MGSCIAALISAEGPPAHLRARLPSNHPCDSSRLHHDSRMPQEFAILCPTCTVFFLLFTKQQHSPAAKMNPQQEQDFTPALAFGIGALTWNESSNNGKSRDSSGKQITAREHLSQIYPQSYAASSSVGKSGYRTQSTGEWKAGERRNTSGAPL